MCIFSMIFIVNVTLVGVSTSSGVCTGDEGGRLLCSHQEEILLAFAASTTGVVLSSIVFLLSIVRSYVGSFYKPDSKLSNNRRRWSNFNNRIEQITSRDPVYWPKEEVRNFIVEHWEEWEAEKPAWFADPRWMANIPPSCLP